MSSTRLVVETHKKAALALDTDITIKGVVASGEYVAVWSGQQVAVYESIRDNSILRPAGTFASTASAIAIHEQTLYCVEEGVINARSLTGVSKQVCFLPFNPTPASL